MAEDDREARIGNEGEPQDVDEAELEARLAADLEDRDDLGVAPLADDPDRSERDGPAPTDPGITTTDSTFPCPYCGEPVDLFLEPSGSRGKEEFVEECPACSRHFEVQVEYDDGGTPHIHANRTD